MIQTRNLQFAYQRKAPLCFADLSLVQGSTLLLRGPSGSGKSTLLALVSGMLTPTAGEVVVSGQSVGSLRAAARDAWCAQHIGFLPQRLHLSEALSVADNLRLVFFAAGLRCDSARAGIPVTAEWDQGLKPRGRDLLWATRRSA